MPSIQQRLQDGLAAFNAGNMAEAEKAFRKVLAQDARNADALNLRGLSLLRLGRAAEGSASIAAAIAVRGSEPSFRLNHGVALKAEGRPDDALAAFREAVRLAPNYAQAHLNIGNTLREKGDLPGAAASFRRTLELAPDTPSVLNNLGNVQREEADFAGAVETYRRAVAVAPNYVEGLTNLGSAALACGQTAVAVDALERAVALAPGNDLIATLLGRTLVYAGRVEEAEASYRRAIELAPRSLEARGDLAELYAGLGLIRQALQVFDDTAAIDGARPRRLSSLLFVSNYDGSLEPAEITARARAFGNSLDRTKKLVLPAIDRTLDRPLRVGLVSGDMRRHVVMEFVLGLLPHFDPARVTLFAYSASPVRDEVTEKLQGLIPNWLDVEKLSDLDLAQRIAGDRIDVLIDMTGHTMNSRLELFALKPAPVQATWLGYSGTTGVEEIDFIVGDAVVTPPAEAAQLIETPWCMPHSYLCYTAPQLEVAVGPLPAAATGGITFGSFNNLGKLSERTMALWSRVLDAVPGSSLLIKSPQLRRPRVADDVRARFERQGVPPDRLILVGLIPGSEGHLAAYNRIDIGLDPFPYNGTTTTAEALWMGVPVLTLRGDRFISHVTESMLRTAGLPDWVAADEDDYVAKAAAFAADRTGLAALRAGLRDQLVASPLCDAPRFARDFTDALHGMWRQKLGALPSG